MLVVGSEINSNVVDWYSDKLREECTVSGVNVLSQVKEERLDDLNLVGPQHENLVEPQDEGKLLFSQIKCQNGSGESPVSQRKI